MAENNENEKMLGISYRIDIRVDVVSMLKEMKDEIRDLAEDKLSGMALEVVRESLNEEDYDITVLSGYDDRETEYLEKFAKDENTYQGSFGSSAKLENWEYMDGDGEWIWLSMYYYEKVSYGDVLKELKDWGEPNEYDDSYIDYDDDDGMITIHGDDEDIKKLIEELSGNPKKEEQFYKLNDLGIEIGAVTRIKPFTCDKIENRICLRKIRTDERFKQYGKYKEAFITCVHTAIAVTNLEDLPEDQEFYIQSNSIARIELKFDQHFFALKSFVQAISEFGLSTLMRESFNYSGLNFGFNNAMHSQFTRAILELDTVLAKELVESFVFDVLNSNPYEIGKKWLIDRHSIISNRFKVRAFRIINQFEFEVYKNHLQLHNAFKKYSNLTDEEMTSMKDTELHLLLNEFVGYPLYHVPKKRDLSVLIEDHDVGEIFDEI